MRWLLSQVIPHKPPEQTNGPSSLDGSALSTWEWNYGEIPACISTRPERRLYPMVRPVLPSRHAARTRLAKEITCVDRNQTHFFHPDRRSGQLQSGHRLLFINIDIQLEILSCTTSSTSRARHYRRMCISPAGVGTNSSSFFVRPTRHRRSLQRRDCDKP